MKRTLTLFVTTAFLIGSIAPSQASISEEFGFFPGGSSSAAIDVLSVGVPPLETPVLSDEVLVYVGEHEDLRNWGSHIYLQPGRPDENLQRDPWIECDSLDDPECDFEKPNYNPFTSVNLGICETESQEDCISNILVSREGETLEATYFGSVPGATVFTGETQMGIITPGIAPIFQVPGAPHSGGDLYLVGARVTSNFQKDKGRFIHDDLYVSITPVTITTNNSGVCAWDFQGSCGRIEEFPKDTVFGVDLRVTNELGGWFLGRMKDPNISVEKLSATNNRMVIKALPVDVARFAYKTKKSLLTSQDRIAVGNVGGTNALFTDEPARLGNDGFDDSVLGMISHFKDRVNDTAVAVTSHWRMRTTSRNGGNSCLTNYDDVLGIVSTNATAYDGFAPQYRNGFIDYRVAGLHYLPGGEELSIGTYDLVMRSDVARCLYGFSKAPVSATVTVTGVDGAENVATTVVSERDGWLKLAAYGFTFSEKEIKVQVTQAQTKTLTTYRGNATALTSKQKAEIKATVTKGGANPKFICTGIRLEGQPQALNTLVRKRAKLACDYAKSLNPKLSTFYQTKTTKARSYNGKVLVVSK